MQPGAMVVYAAWRFNDLIVARDGQRCWHAQTVIWEASRLRRSWSSRSAAPPAPQGERSIPGPIIQGVVLMPTVTSIANQAVFDLPWLVAQEAGLFAQEGIEVVFLPQTPWDAHRPLGGCPRNKLLGLSGQSCRTEDVR